MSPEITYIYKILLTPQAIQPWYAGSLPKDHPWNVVMTAQEVLDRLTIWTNAYQDSVDLVDWNGNVK